MIDFFSAMDSATFLVITAAVAIVLLILRVLIFRPKNISKDFSFKNGMKAGNMQLIGEKESQNDYFTILDKEDSLLCAISNGLTNKKIGKFAAVISIEILKLNYKDPSFGTKRITDYFNTSITQIHSRLTDHIYGNKVGTTLIVTIIKEGYIYMLSMGDCFLYLYRDNELIILNTKDINTYEIKKIKAQKKDIIMLCSKGAHDSLTEMEIINGLEKKIHPYDKCQNFASLIKRKNYNYQDNATIVVLEDLL